MTQVRNQLGNKRMDNTPSQYITSGHYRYAIQWRFVDGPITVARAVCSVSLLNANHAG